jgi:hypothetical protein
MKKIGEYTTRGVVSDGSVEKIQLFDGRFDTGYRVVEFKVFPQDPLSSNTDVIGTLATDDTNFPGAPVWRAEDNAQIAWSGTYVAGSASVFAPFEVIDPDNMVIEDLYIYINNGSSTTSNYFIRMEKYDITDWQGALSMVRNKSQG